METSLESRRLPDLRPLWTQSYHTDHITRDDAHGQPSTVFSTTPSSATADIVPLLHSQSLPSPLYPSFDATMRQHERAMVNRLDARGRKSSHDDGQQSRGLSPIAEDSPTTAMKIQGRARESSPDGLPPASASTPVSPEVMVPDAGPAVLSASAPIDAQRPTLADEARSMLIAGVVHQAQSEVQAHVQARAQAQHHHLQARSQWQVQHAPPPPRTMELASPASRRRQSAPSLVCQPAGALGLRRPSLDPAELLAWGHVHFGDTITADAFVQAVSLRMPSEARTSPVLEESGETRRPSASPDRMSIDSPSPAATTPQTTEGTQDTPRLVTIRARVWPKALERKPFLIQRKFDLDELRAAMPAAGPIVPRLPTPATPMTPMTPMTPITPQLYSAHVLRRRSSFGDGRVPLPGARRRSVPGGLKQLPAAAGSSRSHYQRPVLNLDARICARGSNAVPIHLLYARTRLPVLAALLLSGHIRHGDLIELPLPNPEAWQKTVAFIYTGQGELTVSIRANINYLGGMV